MSDCTINYILSSDRSYSKPVSSRHKRSITKNAFSELLYDSYSNYYSYLFIDFIIAMYELLIFESYIAKYIACVLEAMLLKNHGFNMIYRTITCD